MKHSTLLFCFILCVTQAFSQSKLLLAEISIEEIVYKTDTLRLPTKTNIRLSRVGCSAITSIGKIQGTELGMQIEILNSKLADKEHFIVGKAYFVNKAGKWTRIHEEEHRDISDIISTVLDKKGLADSNLASTGTDEVDFYVTYFERYTVL